MKITRLFTYFILFLFTSFIDSTAYSQDSRIIGGSNIDISDAPYHVAISVDGIEGSPFGVDYRCGGAIIGCNWILTAAHCVDDVLNSDFEYKVRAGRTDVRDFNTGQELEVAEIILHPEDDIALIRLATSLEFNSNVQPIEFATPENTSLDDISPGTDVFITGWGEGSGDILQGATMHIVSEEQLPIFGDCGGAATSIPDDQLACAAANTSPGSGDSGGVGVITKPDGSKVAVGVIHTACNQDPEFNVSFYVNIREFADFIEDNISSMGLCCDENVGIDLDVSEDLVIDSDGVYNSIHVEEDVTLTINYASLGFKENGYIFLDEGAKLVLNNSKLTTASDCAELFKWQGIRTDDRAKVVMNLFSEIGNAEIGVKLGKEAIGDLDGPITFDENPYIIMDTYSGIRNCDIGIFLGVGESKSKTKGFSWLSDNKIGIKSTYSKGLLVDRTYFYDNYIAIESEDSYMRIRDGNAFHGGYMGISLSGTFPLASGIDIGDAGEGYNLFGTEMPIGIRASGNEHPAAVNIVNCKFSQLGAAVELTGANDFEFVNNEMVNCFTGVLVHATGNNNSNELKCNEFENSNAWGGLFLYNNAKSTFLENYFHGNHDVNFALVAAEVSPEIGSPSGSAANCFSESGTNILSESNSAPFDYYYHNTEAEPEDNCQIPNNPDGFVIIEANTAGDYCQGTIGIFQLIDPDDNGIKGIKHEEIALANIDPNSIIVSINIAKDAVVDLGGDDPFTVINESSSLSNAILQRKEAILDQWINFGIHYALETRNFQLAEDILSPLKPWKWQIKYFGFKILMLDFAAAENILDAIPTLNQNQIYFQEIQRINLKRLEEAYTVFNKKSGNNQEWSPSMEDLSLLETVGKSNYSSSGYARSIYQILTGIRLPIDIPELSNNALSG